MDKLHRLQCHTADYDDDVTRVTQCPLRLFVVSAAAAVSHNSTINDLRDCIDALQCYDINLEDQSIVYVKVKQNNNLKR